MKEFGRLRVLRVLIFFVLFFRCVIVMRILMRSVVLRRR